MSLLISTTEQLKAVLTDVGAGLTINVVKSDIARAERKYLKEAFGEDMLEALIGAYDNPNSGSSSASAGGYFTEDQYDKLKLLAQEALAHLSFSTYVLRANARVVNTSVHRNNTEGMEPLGYREIQELSQQYLETGLELLDECLRFLYANKSVFTLWTNSSAYTYYKNLFIPEAVIFDSIVDISESTRTFKVLVPHMKHIEAISLRELLTSDLLEEIRTGWNAASREDHIQEIGELIQKYIAHLSAARLISSSKCKIDRDAIIQIETAGEHIDKKMQANAEDVRAKREFHLETAQTYASEIIAYLIANEDQFENYTAPDAADIVTIKHLLNENGKTIGL